MIQTTGSTMSIGPIGNRAPDGNVGDCPTIQMAIAVVNHAGNPKEGDTAIRVNVD